MIFRNLSTDDIMCEVVRKSFEDVYPQIVKDIRRSDFIALDTEFTGLVTSEATKPSLFDTGSKRYHKNRESVSQFTISQIGISVFCKLGKENKYEAHTYNFYLHPLSFGPFDVRYSVQASSLEFLCVHSFDFNKFVYEGISYLNEPQIDKLEKYLDTMDISRGIERDVDEIILRRCCGEVAEWSIEAQDGDMLTINHKGIVDYVIHLELRQRFSHVWTHPGEYCKISVEKVSEEKRKELEDISVFTERERIFNRMVGFTRIFRIITDLKKPLIGHNMFMDLLLMYEKFYLPLPDSYSQYKKDVHHLFPLIYDTKHIIANIRKPLEDAGLPVSTNLEELFKALDSAKGKYHVLHSPEIVHAPGFDRYVGSRHPHEAGYDAFMVGNVFLRIAHILALEGVKSSLAEPLNFHEYLAVMKKFMNHINIIRATIDHITLEGHDPESSRPQKIYVSATRGRLDASELAQTLSAFGSVDIRMNGQSAALVAVGNKRCSRDILKSLRNSPNLKVSKYDVFKHNSYVRAALWLGVAACGGFFLWSFRPAITQKS